MITGIIVALALTWIGLVVLAMQHRALSRQVDRMCGIEDGT